MFSQYKWAFEIGGIIIFILCIFYGIHKVFQYEQSIGYDRAVAEYTAKALDAEKAMREKEQILNAQVEEARNEAVKRNNQIDQLSRDLGLATNKLRDTVSTNKRIIDKNPESSGSKYTETLGDVLGSCVEEYSEMARDADKERSDSLMYQQAWPK